MKDWKNSQYDQVALAWCAVSYVAWYKDELAIALLGLLLASVSISMIFVDIYVSYLSKKLDILSGDDR